LTGMDPVNKRAMPGRYAVRTGGNRGIAFRRVH